MPKITILTAAQQRAAHKHLQACDENLLSVIKRHGAPQMRHEPDAWLALSASIISQQISTHAARAIRNRVASLGEKGAFPAPQIILNLPDETLRGAGLSQNKLLALRDLARHFDEGKIAPQKLAKMDDEEIIAALLPIRGIGRWTAEMFLIFSLRRPDVLAVDDWGLRMAAKKLYGLDEPPKAKDFLALAEPWRPFRSVASWYLWRSLDNEPKPSEDQQ
jgi:DNA-3-methyladenine glycosylase II